MKIEHILTLSKATMETSSFYYQPASLKVKHYLHLGWHKAHHNRLNNLESFFFPSLEVCKLCHILPLGHFTVSL